MSSALLSSRLYNFLRFSDCIRDGIPRTPTIHRRPTWHQKPVGSTRPICRWLGRRTCHLTLDFCTLHCYNTPLNFHLCCFYAKDYTYRRDRFKRRQREHFWRTEGFEAIPVEEVGSEGPLMGDRVEAPKMSMYH